MSEVQQYYPGDFYGDMQQTLTWLLSRQGGQSGNWQANVAPTSFPVSSAPGSLLVPTSPALEECGVLSSEALTDFSQTVFENITMIPPAGQPLDTTPGPDGFPVNYGNAGLPAGNLFVPVF